MVHSLAEKYTNKSVRCFSLGLGPSALAQRRTPENICNRLRTSHIVHIASHASQNMVEPLSSSIYFPTCTVSMTQLWGSKLQTAARKTKLAIFSACQTAAGLQKMPEEAIHLVPSVVATAWSIVDADGSAFASAFYKHLFQRETVDFEFSAEAVHVAV